MRCLSTAAPSIRPTVHPAAVEVEAGTEPMDSSARTSEMEAAAAEIRTRVASDVFLSAHLENVGLRRLGCRCTP